MGPACVGLVPCLWTCPSAVLCMAWWLGLLVGCSLVCFGLLFALFPGWQHLFSQPNSSWTLDSPTWARWLRSWLRLFLMVHLVPGGMCLALHSHSPVATLSHDDFDLQPWSSRKFVSWTYCSTGLSKMNCGCRLCLGLPFQSGFVSVSNVRPSLTFLPPVSQFPIGEAANPGPTLAISTVNPSGVSGKESILMDLPLGIINVNETHLSAVSMPGILKNLRHLATAQQRRLRISAGSPVALRPQSLTVGVWSGVLQLSDLGCVPLTFPWANSEHRLGRVQVSKFFWKAGVIVGATVYGWPTSPSWPSAHKATGSLLSQLTHEIVHGLQGPRFICGDFNGTDFVDFDLWISCGWVEIQSLWEHISGQSPTPTYKGKTRPDRCFLSPELACHFRTLEVPQLFADHAALIGHFDMDFFEKPGLRWPMVTKLPWENIGLDSWHQSAHPTPPSVDSEHDLTAWLKSFSAVFEDSVQPHCSECPTTGLPRACRGRGQALKPKPYSPLPACPKQSRHGEVKLAASFVSQQVAQWFRQLRRIQALLQNYQAGNDSPGSVLFRLQTWQSILRAKGFAGSFSIWWTVRPHKVQGVVSELPRNLPSCLVLADIFLDFQTNFKAFESWHARQRRPFWPHQYKNPLVSPSRG